MSNLVLLQQQQIVSSPPITRCWRLWSPSTLAAISQCPVENISTAWPAIHQALEARGIASDAVCAAAIGTIAIETASTFRPVREAFWLSEGWRRAHLRYYRFYGRGYIQLTWEENYRKYGRALDVDLVGDPDLALQPDVAASVFAEFFVRSGAAAAAEAYDWAECRRRVQGAHAGLERLVRIIGGLGLPV